MTLVEHLEEVRYRLLVCVAAVMVGTAVAFVFHLKNATLTHALKTSR